MRVVITDCKYKMSLAPLRELHEVGYETVCGEYDDVPDKLLLGSRSRSCGAVLKWSREGNAAENIAAACAEGDVILPVGRATLQSFAEHPELKVRNPFLVSDPDTLDLADDKSRIWALAGELGVPTPATVFLPEGSTPEDFAAQVRYPCIIKYRNGEALGLKSHERYSIARNEEEFVRAYRRMDAISPSPLIQDYLGGQDVGVAVVMDEDSRPVDFLCYVSEREYPLSGGPTCLCRTVFDRQLLRYACDLLQAIHFRGIAMLDFKGSVERPFLLEINPRIWGSAALAAVSGSTFFESYVKAAQGIAEPLDPDTCVPSYRLDARMKFMPHCYMAVLAELKQGRAGAAWHDLRASLSPAVKDGLYVRGDGKPFSRYISNLLSKG